MVCPNAVDTAKMEKMLNQAVKELEETGKNVLKLMTSTTIMVVAGTMLPLAGYGHGIKRDTAVHVELPAQHHPQRTPHLGQLKNSKGSRGKEEVEHNLTPSKRVWYICLLTWARV